MRSYGCGIGLTGVVCIKAVLDYCIIDIDLERARFAVLYLVVYIAGRFIVVLGCVAVRCVHIATVMIGFLLYLLLVEPLCVVDQSLCEQ